MTEKPGGLVVTSTHSSKVKTNGGIAEVDAEGRASFFKQDMAQCDIVFVMDTTGSMSDKIDGLIATSQAFVDEIADRQISWQIAIVTFGDLTVQGDRILATDFSLKVEVIKRSLRNSPRNSGGSNVGESSLEAMDRALALPGYRQGAMKVFIVMTDEPALQVQLTPEVIIQKLRSAGVLTFVISNPEPYFKAMAAKTRGEWFQVGSGTDFLSILDRLVKTVGRTITEVQLKAGGDVQKYLQLNPGRDD